MARKPVAFVRRTSEVDAVVRRRLVDVLSSGIVMAHLWIPAADERDWQLLPLAAVTSVGDSAQVLGSYTPEGRRWVLLGSPAVRVNGLPVGAGLVALRDRDEICADGRRVFFSSEALAAVVPFPGGERATICPRCMLEIPAEAAAVACPQCRVWHHSTDPLPCWTYAERCALCDQATALDAGFRWTPEAL